MRDSPRPAATEVSVTPKNVGRFRCEVRLGGDGWFESFRARVQGLQGFDRVFAVQCLAPGALARRPQAAENLLRAARAAADVRDVRIATVHDSGLAPGSAFVAHELVHGLQLRALVSYFHPGTRGPAPPPSWEAMLAYVGAEIAGALAAAHARPTPVVHGALAPSAVMVTAQGAIKLLDLGLRASVLTPAEIAAHPSRGPHAAPEVTRGATPAPPGDAYALGSLLHMLATGSPRAEGAGATGVPLALAPALMALLSVRAETRPSLAETEKRLREVVGRMRGVDVRAELGGLVRLVTQVRASQPELHERPSAGVVPGSDTPEDVPAPAAPSDSGAFTEEPTAIVGLNGDGLSPLASLLRDMRYQPPEGGRDTPPALTFRPTPTAANSNPTPAHGTALSDADLEPPPVSVPARAPAPAPIAAAPAVAPAAVTVGTPGKELDDLTTAEIHASVGRPIENGARSAIPHVVPLGESAGPMALVTPKLTPPSWQPAGDLEADLSGERPGSLGGIELPTGRRSPRTWALVAAGTGMLALTVTTVMLAMQRTRVARETTSLMFKRPIDESPAPRVDPLPAGPSRGRSQPGGDATRRPGATPAEAPPEAPPAAAAPTTAAAPVPAAAETRTPAPAPTPAASPTPAPATAPAKGARAATTTTTATTASKTGAPATTGTPAAAGAPAPAGESPPTSTPPTSTTPPPVAPAPVTPPAAGEGAPAAGGPPAELELRTSPPGATVWMAGAARGVTPLRLAVPPGARELRLVRAGYETRLVTLDGGTDKVIEQTLTATSAPAGGDALVSVECTDTRKLPVLVDGRETGLLCPTGFFGLSPGPHEMGVLDPATGERHTQAVTLEKGQRRLRLPSVEP
jgi:hypothetical protein